MSLNFYTSLRLLLRLGHSLITTVAEDSVLQITGQLLRGGADPNLTVTVAYEQDIEERASPLELAIGRGLPELVLLPQAQARRDSTAYRTSQRIPAATVRPRRALYFSSCKYVTYINAARRCRCRRSTD